MIFGNKKGNAIIEGITVIVILTVFGLISVFSYQVFDEMNSDLISDPSIDTEAAAVSNTLYEKHDTLFDNLFLMIFVLFTIFTIISAFMIDTHPIFFIVSVILLAGTFLVAGLMANVYDDVMMDSSISTYANSFTYTSWVMGHLLELMIAIGFMIAIVLFIKYKS